MVLAEGSTTAAALSCGRSWSPTLPTSARTPPKTTRQFPLFLLTRQD
jgi:hypothetical protein